MIDRCAIEQTAAIWLMRRGELDWSAADALSLDQWLEQSVAHKAAFWRIEHGYAQADRLAALAPRSEYRGASWAVPLWSKVLAASVIVALACSYAFLSRVHHAPEAAQYSTARGQIGSLTLADGSNLDLNADTRIRVAQDGHSRQLWLSRGEIFLSVAHDSGRPFIVHSDKGDVTVLGTKFSVSRTEKTISIAVVEGHVRLAAADRPSVAAVVLNRGDVAVSDGHYNTIRFNQLDQINNQLGWRQGVLNFDDTPLSEAAALFNRYNKRQLVIGDEATASTRIGGSFKVGNVDGFLRLLERAYGLEVRVKDQQIEVFSRK
ncbi:FecR domain-containing protein [Sphingobium sp. H39-3-25]|uniref:FecR family protein n=1 Tax=Sphingobium arseniciresistens TaxID=3030834 RepID=UPI0023B98572|nr:FecR domain-containing protein [Sphingobium arseniciresistens]